MKQLRGDVLRVDVAELRVLVDPLERFEDHLGIGEDPVGQEERVEEIDAQEAQVRQSVQKLVDRRMTNLGTNGSGCIFS